MKSTKILLFSFFPFLFSLNAVFAAFTDTEYSWYEKSIENLQSQWLTNGYGDGRYGTENNITRAELLTILLRASNTPIPETVAEKCFPDVETTMWYHRYICTAHTLGIANGFSDGNFKPNDSVTTLEALAFGNKAFWLNVATTGEKWYEPLQQFSDTNNIMPTRSYTLGTQISRGKSADLIIRLQEYSRTKSPLSYKSAGCEAWGILSGENTITIEGKERKYNLFVPSNYSRDKEYALAIATHGRTNSKDQVQDYMKLEKQSDFIIAYPAGLASSSGKSFSWSEKENMTFVDAILEQVSDNYCINRDSLCNRTFSRWLDGSEDSLSPWRIHQWPRGRRIRTFYRGMLGPAPSLFFQNVNDHLSSYASGVQARNIRLKVNERSESSTESIQIGPLTCTKYNTCSTGNEVVWCERYTGYGGDPHSWPTGGGWQSPGGGTWILDYFRGL